MRTTPRPGGFLRPNLGRGAALRATAVMGAPTSTRIPRTRHRRRRAGLAACVVLVGIAAALASGPATASAPFKACFVNAGSYASMGPCYGSVGALITIRTSRKLPVPIGKVWFYEISSQAGAGGTICYSCATVTVSLTGGGNLARGGTAAGSYYQFKAPSQLCLNGSEQGWAAFPIPVGGPTPSARYGYGDIGTFTIDSCPAASPASTGLETFTAGQSTKVAWTDSAGNKNTIQITSITACGMWKDLATMIFTVDYTFTAVGPSEVGRTVLHEVTHGVGPKAFYLEGFLAKGDPNATLQANVAPPGMSFKVAGIDGVNSVTPSLSQTLSMKGTPVKACPAP